MAIPREKFEKLVAETLDEFPEKFRERIKNVAVLIEDEPSQVIREAEGLGDDETLLGLYQGVPATVRGESYGVGPTLPDTITLFQFPIEDAAGGDSAHIREVIRDTIWHEYAHYFGMEEHEVRKREDERSS